MKLQDILTQPVIEYPENILPGYRRRVVEAVICRDGTQLSVQASRGHYCNPRNNEGPWTTVEVMVGGVELSADWVKHMEYYDLYSNVPIALVEALIEEHGGEA